MSSPATGSFYGVMTFLLVAGAFYGLANWAWGWEFPTDNRSQSSVMVLVFIGAGIFARNVGRHRDVHYLEALRRGAIDLGRALKSLIFR
jgi:hypothetical protein